jgi:hypothetical protein
MNSQRRWSWKQTTDVTGQALVLQPGSNVVYWFANNLGASPQGPALFADPGTYSVWPSAQPRVSVEIEFSSTSALTAAPEIRVAGYTFIPYFDSNNPSRFIGGNLAVKLVNTGSTAVTAGSGPGAAGFTIVWHFESFVTNYDGQGPSIG